MERKDILNKLTTILVEQLNVNPDQVDDDARIVEDLGADSLDVIELCMAVEMEFETEVLDEDAERWTTVGQVVDYLVDL